MRSRQQKTAVITTEKQAAEEKETAASTTEKQAVEQKETAASATEKQATADRRAAFEEAEAKLKEAKAKHEAKFAAIVTAANKKLAASASKLMAAEKAIERDAAALISDIKARPRPLYCHARPSLAEQPRGHCFRARSRTLPICCTLSVSPLGLRVRCVGTTRHVRGRRHLPVDIRGCRAAGQRPRRSGLERVARRRVPLSCGGHGRHAAGRLVALPRALASAA